MTTTTDIAPKNYKYYAYTNRMTVPAMMESDRDKFGVGFELTGFSLWIIERRNEFFQKYREYFYGTTPYDRVDEVQWAKYLKDFSENANPKGMLEESLETPTPQVIKEFYALKDSAYECIARLRTKCGSDAADSYDLDTLAMRLEQMTDMALRFYNASVNLLYPPEEVERKS